MQGVQKTHILAQANIDSHAPIAKINLRWIILIIAFVVLMQPVLSSLATIPNSIQPSADIREVVEVLQVPDGVTTLAQPLAAVKMEHIKAGDTVIGLLDRLGITDQGVRTYITTSTAGNQLTRSLRAGERAVSATGDDGRLIALTIPLGGDDNYVLRTTGNGFEDKIEKLAYERKLRVRSGIIRSSLFGATDAAGLSDETAMKLADIFGTSVDFRTDIRSGDSFGIVYEAKVVDGVEVGVERILVAEFINKGKKHVVYLFRDDDGRESYYGPDGSSLSRGFLRSPLPFTRITSGFKMRFHPIQKIWRQHKGVDFGGPRGTPIRATSDGIIQYRGTQRGYGNVIEISHRGKISTLYGHMNNFAPGFSKGSKVRQGDVIGFVGSTGWATGPHLHYEFRIAGVPVDPLSSKLPITIPLEGKEKARFQAGLKQYNQYLAFTQISQSDQ